MPHDKNGISAAPSGLAASPKKYFASIDGLRLIASINIVLFHLEQAGALDHLHGSPGWLFTILKGPAFHASLFFLLGGFIYCIKFAGKETTFDIRSFFWKRLKTLYPLHVATTLLMVLLCVISASHLNLPRLVLSTLLHFSGTWAFWPQKWYMLNSPAWALSAFFLCYLLLGHALRFTERFKTRGTLLGAMAGCFAVLFLWSGLYAAIGDQSLYHQFHVFAPVRFFEFLIGMLLARRYLLNPSRSTLPAFVNDLIVIVICVGIFFTARQEHYAGDRMAFFLYHSAMIPFYAVLVYRMAREGGFFASFFALKPVRSLGMCSFYPYLLHIPLSSLTCTIAKRVFGFDGLFHEPLPLIVFMIALYVGSALVWGRLRTGRSTPSASK
ncbi:MAG: acyltransferase [Chitinispirillaceae bacterium]|nr:acyltransferase [Chitinispirillaceae bacterium]